MHTKKEFQENFKQFKEPIVIDAAPLREMISQCEEWLSLQEKSPFPSFQQAQTEAGVAAYKQVLDSAVPYPI